MSFHRGLALLGAALLFLSACGAPSKTSSPTESVPQAMAKASESDFYAEEPYKGRTHVFGTEKAHQRFKASSELPGVGVSFIGAGTNGETVVLEADAKNAALQERLKGEFNRRHGPRLP